jgi:hypothetical protein
MVDAWGDIYKSQWSGRPSAYEIERDDGRVDRFASASNYFASLSQSIESELFNQLCSTLRLAQARTPCIFRV